MAGFTGGVGLRSGALALTVLALPAPCLAQSAQDVSKLLLEKTQAFSDAGQRNDVAVMAPLLDERVVFFNEGGDRATRTDMIAPGPAPGAGVKIRMTVTDWNCQLFGNVAVTSFIDDQSGSVSGEPVHARYRSVETWLKEGADWRMIGSQTLALQDDPAAVKLSTAVLDGYVGRYRSATGATFTFTRRGDDLFAAVGDGPPTPQKAEVRDVVFTPGRARVRKVFQRDASGRVTGFAYRREGHDTAYARLPDPAKKAAS